jgi:hypothetical protein
MTAPRAVLAVVAGTIVLVVWYGLTQLFPWGTRTVSNFSATSGEAYATAAPELVEAPAGTWTTEAFEEQLGGRISTLATDRSFSWIVAAPRQSYGIPGYFAFQFLTQAGVAACLTLVLGLLAPLPRPRRLAVVGTMGLAATVGIYGGMMNWWGMPAGYGVGESVNAVAAWLLAGAVIDRLILGKRTA